MKIVNNYELNKIEKVLLEDRKIISMEFHALSSKLEALNKPKDNLPDESPDTVAMHYAASEAVKHNAEITRIRGCAESAASAYANAQEDLQQAQAHLVHTKAVLKKADDALSMAGNPIDIERLSAELKDAYETEKDIYLAGKYIKLATEVREKRRVLDRINTDILAVRREQPKLMESIK